MYSFVLFLHVVICLGLLVLILIQRSKSSDIGASFGAGASATMFGAAGATSFLVKLTAIFGILFFATSLTLGVMSAHFVAAKNTVENAVLAAATQASEVKKTEPKTMTPVIPEGPKPVGG
jgi:preprotein translocase subunit SecG